MQHLKRFFYGLCVLLVMTAWLVGLLLTMNFILTSQSFVASATVLSILFIIYVVGALYEMSRK